ncbi:hypothetical protein ACWCQN_42290 [Streptomyces sp. NPDC001984]
MMGPEVTLAKPQPVPVRPFGEPIGAFVAELHHDHGTRLRCGVPVHRLHDAGGGVTRVELADGNAAGRRGSPGRRRRFRGWLAGSGLRLGDGI